MHFSFSFFFLPVWPRQRHESAVIRQIPDSPVQSGSHENRLTLTLNWTWEFTSGGVQDRVSMCVFVIVWPMCLSLSVYVMYVSVLPSFLLCLYQGVKAKFALSFQTKWLHDPIWNEAGTELVGYLSIRIKDRNNLFFFFFQPVVISINLHWIFDEGWLNS